jgi:hypothetical protein
MKPDERPSESSGAVVLARLLATAAAGDTLMRDLYLGRARALLEPICSEARYRSAQDNRIAVNRLLAQSRTAVGRQDWAQVERMISRTSGAGSVSWSCTASQYSSVSDEPSCHVRRTTSARSAGYEWAMFLVYRGPTDRARWQ